MSRTALCLMLTLLPRLAAAQVVVVDEGTFTLLVRGGRVGREDFSIRRSPPAAEAAFVAQANVLVGDGRVSVALSTDSAGTPLRFKHETFAAGQVTTSVTGEWRAGLWSGRSVTPLGESAREFRLAPGTLGVEGGVIHHLWFLLRFAPVGRPTTTLLPRGLQLRTVRVEAAGSEPLAIGLSEFQARKYLVRLLPAGTPLYEVWTDAEGRLLRVRAPAESLEALRDEPPAETSGDAAAYALQPAPFPSV